MSIYRGIIKFADGRKFDDIWVNKEDAMGYFEHSPSYDGCVRWNFLKWLRMAVPSMKIRLAYMSTMQTDTIITV